MLQLLEHSEQVFPFRKYPSQQDWQLEELAPLQVAQLESQPVQTPKTKYFPKGQLVQVVLVPAHSEQEESQTEQTFTEFT